MITAQRAYEGWSWRSYKDPSQEHKISGESIRNLQNDRRKKIRHFSATGSRPTNIDDRTPEKQRRNEQKNQYKNQRDAEMMTHRWSKMTARKMIYTRPTIHARHRLQRNHRISTVKIWHKEAGRESKKGYAPSREETKNAIPQIHSRR